MKFVKLTRHAYVNGQMRSPAEGVLHLEDDEADRVISNDAAEDVTSDFADADQAAPVEALAADKTDVEAAQKLGGDKPQTPGKPGGIAVDTTKEKAK